MTVRWQFLSDQEKNRLEEYDFQMSSLIGKTGKREEEAIKQLHQQMDCFIIELQEKYCPVGCGCRK